MKSLKQNEIELIFNVFKGMDEEYIRLIRKYHNSFLDERLTVDAKNKEKELAKIAIKELKQRYIEKALSTIQAIKDSREEKPEKKEYTKAEMLYNMTLWTNLLPHADANELKELYGKYKDHEDFMKLLQVEFKKRKSDGNVQSLRHTIENPVKDSVIAELDKTVNSFKSIASMNVYPQKLHETTFANIKYRNVDQDLNAYPITEGPNTRNIFGAYWE